MVSYNTHNKGKSLNRQFMENCYTVVATRSVAKFGRLPSTNICASIHEKSGPWPLAIPNSYISYQELTQQLQSKVSLSGYLTHVDLFHVCAPSDPD